MQYSLSKHILGISLPSILVAQLGLSDLSIGGEGSYLDSISIELTNDFVTTEGDATGSYVHNVNLSEVGTCNISINQMSDKVAKFKRIVNLFRTAVKNGIETNGMTMTLTDLNNNVIATMEDCFFTKIPPQEYGQTASPQSWSLTCGRVIFN